MSALRTLGREFAAEHRWIWRGVQLSAAAALGSHLSELIELVRGCL